MLTQLRLRLTGLTTGLTPTYWFLWLGTLVNRLGGFVVPFLTLSLTDQTPSTPGSVSACSST